MRDDSAPQLLADAEAGEPAAPAPVGRARIPELLHAAVTAVGGVERPGQIRMAEAVAEAVDSAEHLLVQAGTGTGKSLAYLVPALAHGDRVVVATATLALQRQLVERDLPRTVEALHPILRRRPLFAMLKGRSNYLCLHRAHEGTPSDEGEGLFDPAEALGGPTGKLGQDVLRLRDWADETETGDRDDLTPGVSDKAWAQLSVSSRECLGATRCAYGQECFAEQARERAKLADVVVTNHALLAIDALEGAPVLPEHELLIVDEAHELVNRVTGAATAELTVSAVNRAVKRAARLANEKAVDALQAAAESYHGLMETAQAGRVEELPEYLAYAVTAIRDASRQVITSLGETRDKSLTDEDAVRKQAMAMAETLHDTTDRLLTDSPYDVIWIERNDRFGMGTASLRVAPMSVSGLLRENLYKERSVVLTSATLKLGGDFNGVAASVGLPGEGRLPEQRTPAEPERGERAEDAPPLWRGLDVGSPFSYPKQGILYVAKHLPPPGREPERPQMLDELAELIEAAGGRTLGLFSSMRARPDGRRAAARALGLPDPAAGRGHPGRADPQLLGRRRDLPLRHPLALAGRRCARFRLPVGGDGPDPVPASGRSADERAAEGGRGGRRQRLHGGGGDARRAADGAGRGSAGPGGGGPRRGRGARPAAGDRSLRRLLPLLDAGLLVHHRPQPGAALAGGHRRLRSGAASGGQARLSRG
ncbi:ATP-dependent DNA helicase DinG [Kitasatospora sp. MAP12-44]|nr:ATP-dependent DNA helicase DinG [Kitasatospora sp. MAP12-44]